MTLDFEKINNDFEKRIPFLLTNAQKKVVEELKRDFASGYAMNRLVQGDVGSGKTVVAEAALFACIKEGYQGALMVPTEVLAKQHYEEISEMFDKYGIKTACLVGSTPMKEKRHIYEGLKSGDIDIIIGTHALIEDKVEYNNLGLVVTDEQHRFGVNQRKKLTAKGDAPHTLVMSATPIPRTLAIIMYADLDISVISELPRGRKPIKNCVVGEVITIDGNAKIISTSKDAHKATLHNDFNFEFFKIGNTIDNKSNHIYSTLPCKCVLRYKPIIK